MSLPSVHFQGVHRRGAMGAGRPVVRPQSTYEATPAPTAPQGFARRLTTPSTVVQGPAQVGVKCRNGHANLRRRKLY
jgi:hypothetical protein